MRKIGVITIPCCRCQVPNGVSLLMLHAEPTALFQCYACDGVNRVRTEQDPVNLNASIMGAVPKGVKVHGGIDK